MYKRQVKVCCKALPSATYERVRLKDQTNQLRPATQQPLTAASLGFALTPSQARGSNTTTIAYRSSLGVVLPRRPVRGTTATTAYPLSSAMPSSEASMSGAAKQQATPYRCLPRRSPRLLVCAQRLSTLSNSCKLTIHKTTINILYEKIIRDG